MPPTYWALTVAEWLTIAAIILGPIVAVAIQLWMQSRKAKHDTRLWVFRTLMGQRGNIVDPAFVQAFNLVDVVFYECADIRKKRADFMEFALRIGDRDLTTAEVDQARDIIAEMLARIGSKLGFKFDHTELKNLAYYPRGFGQYVQNTTALITKALAVLDGRASLPMVIRDDDPHLRLRPPR